MCNPEEWGYLPYGHLQRAGEGDRACLYCRYYDHHPPVLCLPLTVCSLHQGVIPNGKVSSVVCSDWTPRKRN